MCLCIVQRSVLLKSEKTVIPRQKMQGKNTDDHNLREFTLTMMNICDVICVRPITTAQQEMTVQIWQQKVSKSIELSRARVLKLSRQM